MNGGKVVFGVSAEPDGFDPMANQFASQSLLIGSSMLEGVMTFGSDGATKPHLADMTPFDLATRWQIKAHPGITFHDGTPFDANALKANLDGALKGIGSIGLKTLKTVTVVDPMTVEVQMSEPWASFPSLLAGDVGLMISPKTIATPEAALHPVGTGPFEFEKWDKGATISVKKYAHYWQKDQPHLDAIDFRIITDPGSQVAALKAGDVDTIVTDDTTSISQLRSDSAYTTILDRSGDAQSMWMNEAAPPFDNADARKAVVLATDDKALTDAFGNGLLQPINQPFADSSPYHDPDPHYAAFDLAGAKKAVAAYTATTGKPLEFTLTVFTGNANLQMAQILQQQWAQAGIKANINSQEQASAIKDIIVGNDQAATGPNFGYPDPDYNYIFWHSTYTAPVGQLAINFPHIKLDAVDKGLYNGRVNLVPSIRQEAYRQAVRAMNENNTYVWLYRYVAALVAQNHIHGLQQAEQLGFTGLQFHNWYGNLWLDKQ